MLETFIGIWSGSGLGALTRLSVDFKRYVTCNGDFVLLNDPKEIDTPLLFHAHTAEGVTVVGLLPNGEPVMHRLADDEAALVAGARINSEKRIGELDAPDQDRLFSVMVALVKLLHNISLPSYGYGRWYVVGVDLDIAVMYALIGMPMRVQIEREVGCRMTRSSIQLGGIGAARINFIRSVAV